MGMSELDPTARIVWKLCRNHTWGQPMPEDVLVDTAAKDEDHDEMREYLKDALDLSFVTSDSHGVYIPNGQDKHQEAADWLHENTTMPEYKIRASLSRLPNDWPKTDPESNANAADSTEDVDEYLLD
jgi:hypothetical protein